MLMGPCAGDVLPEVNGSWQFIAPQPGIMLISAVLLCAGGFVSLCCVFFYFLFFFFYFCRIGGVCFHSANGGMLSSAFIPKILLGSVRLCGLDVHSENKM